MPSARCMAAPQVTAQRKIKGKSGLFSGPGK
jgi:hypothetical protein